MWWERVRNVTNTVCVGILGSVTSYVPHLPSGKRLYDGYTSLGEIITPATEIKRKGMNYNEMNLPPMHVYIYSIVITVIPLHKNQRTSISVFD